MDQVQPETRGNSDLLEVPQQEHIHKTLINQISALGLDPKRFVVHTPRSAGKSFFQKLYEQQREKKHIKCGAFQSRGVRKGCEKMIKDSGQRKQMAGMVREVTDGKVKYHLVFDGPMLDRWAKHLTEGAKKYSERNWTGAKSQEELDRFVESAVRHFVQWLKGEADEDHAAAVFFNINGAEHVKEKLRAATNRSLVMDEVEMFDRRLTNR